MSPFAALFEVSRVPPWRGPASVYRLLDGPPPKAIPEPRRGRPPGSCKKAKPRRWVPWTLMTPQREAEIAAGVWDMTNLWPFPADTDAPAAPCAPT